jgi:hypothetical protein
MAKNMKIPQFLLIMLLLLSTCQASGLNVEVSSLLSFPVAALGYCEDGSQKIESILSAHGIETRIAVHEESSRTRPGHMWIVAMEANESIAIDSYFGIVSGEYYSNPRKTFSNFAEYNAYREAKTKHYVGLPLVVHCNNTKLYEIDG